MHDVHNLLLGVEAIGKPKRGVVAKEGIELIGTERKISSNIDSNKKSILSLLFTPWPVQQHTTSDTYTFQYWHIKNRIFFKLKLAKKKASSIMAFL